MDNNANNYMLLQQRNVRIPLLAKNGTWKFTINKEKWEIPDCMERLYAYHLIGNQDYKATSATLRANYKHITPIQIEAFIQHFEKTHPVEEYQFNINEVPVYATEKNPLFLPNRFSQNILITAKQEQELLKIIESYPIDTQREFVINWFEEYIIRYDLRPKKESEDTDHCFHLIEVFYQTHGINDNIYSPEEMEKYYLKGWGGLTVAYILFALFLIFALLYSFWGNDLFKGF